MNNERGEVTKSSADSLEPLNALRRRTVEGGRQSARLTVYFINIHGGWRVGRRKEKCPSLPGESERRQELTVKLL